VSASTRGYNDGQFTRAPGQTGVAPGATVPNKNRPLVRDGRIQAQKKRTDRSYLRPGAAPTTPEAYAEEARLDAEDAVENELPAAEPMPEVAAVAPTATSVASSSRRVPGRAAGSVRAMQQQGVRHRRELNVSDLAVRDTRYAIHELRRIAVLAALVVITLIVLTIVLR